MKMGSPEGLEGWSESLRSTIFYHQSRRICPDLKSYPSPDSVDTINGVGRCLHRHRDEQAWIAHGTVRKCMVESHSMSGERFWWLDKVRKVRLCGLIKKKNGGGRKLDRKETGESGKTRKISQKL
ncbi:hypothetical protein ACH5RR_015635 [Cinchona calisaya]|uniref:Uncharacterized protein n=1 Tax=Cinchona calisaya TaxID=153742 RepID=A0ABD2ZTR1_9GENT